MLQKYKISRDLAKNTLHIKEYAVLEKKERNQDLSHPERGNYTLLCEEIYDGKRVEASISEGLSALIATIRTTNIYPINPYAQKIAESVTSLYSSTETGIEELFFNDTDLLPKPPEDAS